MVSNTEAMNANQFYGSGPSSTQATAAGGGAGGGTGGAIGRLRQTLQQAQESVSNRLTQTRAGYQQQSLLTTDQQANEANLAQSTAADSQQNVQGSGTNNSEEKENQEAA